MIYRTYRLILGLLLAFNSFGCFSVSQVASLGSPEKAGVVETDQVSHFICWNVHKASHERFKEEVALLMEDIPEEDGVILCMQEVRSSTYEKIKDLHREDISGHYAPSWRFPLSRQSTGVLTIANQSLPASGAVALRSPRREMYVASPKMSLRTAMPIQGGGEVEIINCHGLNFVTESVFPMQLDEVFAALKTPGAPAIVCGDFNTWSEARLKMLRDKAEAMGLSEVEVAGEEHSPAPKWLRRLNLIDGFNPDLRLDRIFTRGIEVIDCHSDDRFESSDHRPLVMRFKVKRA
ncbi:endonuclease/exonuclease/phosphatase family protein [Haloferula rosea]|uniref:Endonuclease/exonuclease/phosphatase family protein n=1 Tax=Haloferula rosea TaxID=490093 RepID=A0A934VFQ6_9BACT|nr:endonuclease/exonuclease/phosphatase family protein [Haloferula rosea]MBK1828604.1 endonuclease/exonuclease/phosphatase family protein [Haloferula rosea]